MKEIVGFVSDNEHLLRKKMLLAMRESLIIRLEMTNNLLPFEKEELVMLNEEICGTYGHEFLGWEEKNKSLYTKKCSICGKKEKTKFSPKGFMPGLVKTKRKRG